MATDFFLKINGVPGESKDHKHKDEIDLLSWSWGASQTGGFAYGGGGGAGKVSMQDFHFTMKVNKATPKLQECLNTGTHIKDAILTCRKAGKEQQEFLIYKFYDLLISSYQTGGSDGMDIPTESISFNYSKYEVTYKEQKQDGTLGGAIVTNYDLKTNKKA